MDYGFISVLPPLIAIALAIVTKDVLLSIIAAVYAGYFAISHCNPLLAFRATMDGVAEILGNVENIMIVLIVVFLGGLVGLMIKSGGSNAFAGAMSKKIKTRNGVQLAAWMTGICIFFDDYFNCMLIGPVMRPITDAKRVSREKLAYIIDSTSASMCTLTPVSSWVAYLLGILATTYATLEIADAPLVLYLHAIPFNMYAIFALLLVPLVVYFNLDFGPMARAEKRAVTEGKLNESEADESSVMVGSEFNDMEISPKGRWIDLILPVAALLVIAFLVMFWTGGLFDGASFVTTFQEADSISGLFYSTMGAIVIGAVFYKLRGSVKFRESVSAVVVGMKSMVLVVVFMTCAWMLGSICETMGTGEYLVRLVADAQVGFLIPILVFVITCVITFATGSGWGSIAIMVPIALPMGVAMDANLPATLAAVLSGVVFGDHCSPICDTTIISSAGAQCSHLDHCKTQIPYAITAAAAAASGFLAAGFMANPIIPLLVGVAVFVLLLIVLSKFTRRRDARVMNADAGNPA
ncbi:MAG: Na+/H+ antiporter NhaC family protein [Clostridiales Family XIII bacterium]|jgi:Na+/H+ antiporter NhaC|nr:Na+/H+ antiporter NhaC family protein [Clostridiales Family XIII bacterium]